jgi:hypothetical protein
MAHWLEEAENEKQEEVKKPRVSRTKIQQKTEDIRKNYEANKEAYDGFINSLFTLCQRANNLPPESREPWGMIESKSKESKLNSHLYSFSTRERFDMKVPIKSFPFIKLRHFKHVRKVMFSVSKTHGMSNIEILDDYIAKTRLSKDDGVDIKEVIDDGLERYHLIFHIAIKDLNEALTLKLLDWLAFRKDLDHLPFTEKDIKRNGKTRTSTSG